MIEKVVYFDENYPGAWIDKKEWNEKLVEHLKKLEFEEKKAEELRDFMNERLKGKNANKSVVVFSKDMMPDTILSGMNSPDDLIHRYLDAGGRTVWIGDHPFWDKGKNRSKITQEEKDRDQIYQHGTHYAMLGVEMLIAESSSPCIWTDGWNKIMKSRWHSKRPVNIEVDSIGVESGRPFNLRVKPLRMEVLAYAEVTLLPCSLNAIVISRWKKAGKKVGSFGLR